jgi:hypothetical protein
MLHGGFFYEEIGSGKRTDCQPGWWHFLSWHDEDTATYRFSQLEMSGRVDHGTYRFEGSDKVSEYEKTKGGKTYKMKVVIQVAPDKKRATFEQLYFEDGENWKSQCTAKVTKMR